MTADEIARQRRVKELFAQALELPATERISFVNSLVLSDPALAKDVSHLLSLHASPRLTLDFTAPPPFRRMPGEVLAQRYRIERFLAAGGMGEVYAATDLLHQTLVALKFIRPFSSIERHAEERLQREVRLAQRIAHPNVCRVLALTSDSGQQFCVMEFLDGETLADRLRDCGPLSPSAALAVALQLCDALTAAHRAGVLHRDIKPGNVFLVGDRAVLIDFGLASAVVRDDSLTLDGAVVGTLAYVAPEQLHDDRATEASDIYSLGIVFHEMLTGCKPHDAKSPFRLASQKNQATSLPLLNKPTIPAVWAEVISRCLRTNPAHRFASVDAVRQSLLRARPSAVFLATRWVSRPAVAFLLLTLFLLPAAALLWSLRETGHRPAPDAARLFDQALNALAEAAPERAAALLDQAVTRDRHFTKAYALLSVVNAESDRLNRARDAILQATLAADQRWYLGRLERLALNAARAVLIPDYSAAAHFFERWATATLGQERTFLQLCRGRMLERSGQPDLAMVAYDSALRQQPDYHLARLAIASLLSRRQHYHRAAAEFSLAEAAFRRQNNIEGLAAVLLARSNAFPSRPLPDDLHDASEALRLALQSGNRYQELSAKFRLATLAIREREYARSAALAHDTAEAASRAGFTSLAAHALGELGYALLHARQPAPALPILRDAVAMAEQARSYNTLAVNRLRLGEVLAILGQRRAAIEAMRPAIGWYRQPGQESQLPFALIKWATAHEDPIVRQPLFAEALALARKHAQPAVQAVALQRLASDAWPNNLQLATRYAEELLPLARLSANHGSMLRAADIFGDFGRFDEALAIIREVQNALTEYPAGVDRDSVSAQARLVLARLHLTRRRCAEGLAAIRSVSPASLLPYAIDLQATRVRLEACAPDAPRARLAANLAALAPGASTNPTLALAAAETALTLRRLRDASRLAALGITTAAGTHRLREFELTLLLRATESPSRDHPLTVRSLTLARELGFDPPDQFTRRPDLRALWTRH
jgi:predicted Ser/Thr protein kinase